MKTASVSRLKASLSAYLRRVRRGEEVLVTDRGRPVARLSPISAVAGLDLPEAVREMAAQGLIRLPRRALPRDVWTRPRPKVPEGAALRALLQDREESM